MTDDSLVFFGGDVKATGDGKVAGYLVRYGFGPDDADVQGDYFVPNCDFGLDTTSKFRIYYHHGLDKEFGKRSYGIGEVKGLPDGLWIDGTIDLSTDPGRRLYGLVERGECGWSSGSSDRFVERERDTKGKSAIKSWPLNDASVSRKPVDGRNRAIAIKSLIESPQDEGTVSASLVEQTDALVSRASELAGLFGTVADAHPLNAAKRQAIKAAAECFDRLYDATAPRPDPEQLRRFKLRRLAARLGTT